MGGPVVVEHEVDGVGGGDEEDDLENGEVQLRELVKGPQQVDITRDVDNEVEELRFERDAVGGLKESDGREQG